MKKILILFLCILFSLLSCSKPTDDRFNLMFNYSDKANFVWDMNLIVPTMRIDSSEHINSKYPLCLESNVIDHKSAPSEYFHIIRLHQKLILPTALKNEMIEISIHNKCTNLEKIILKVVGLDNQGNIQLSDSIDINNDGLWQTKWLKTNLSNSSNLVISILGNGIENKESSLYLYQMTVTIAGQNINSIEGINDLTAQEPEIFNTSNITPIPLLQEKNLLKSIDMDTKRIIALGETVHGSKSINDAVFFDDEASNNT